MATIFAGCGFYPDFCRKSKDTNPNPNTNTATIFAGCGFHPDSHCCQFSIFDRCKQKEFSEISVFNIFYQYRFSPGFTLLAFDNLRTVAPNSICDWCSHQMRAEVAKRTERQFFLLVLLLMLSIHTWLWIRRLWSLQLLSYPSLLQVPISPKFEANFWPDERLEQVRIPLSCWRPFFNCSVSGEPAEKKSTILWQQF